MRSILGHRHFTVFTKGCRHKLKFCNCATRVCLFSLQAAVTGKNYWVAFLPTLLVAPNTSNRSPMLPVGKSYLELVLEPNN
eukprot:465961-Rhodomonas_salina.1